jgi:hypothetical protein
LILYLTKWLKFDDDNATGIYHGFIFLCYFSPLFGAIIADGYLGRYSGKFQWHYRHQISAILLGTESRWLKNKVIW